MAVNICHCGEPAPLFDRATVLWQCLPCRYGVNEDCGCGMFVSPHAKAMWVRKYVEEKTGEQQRDTKRDIPIAYAKYNRNDLRDAQFKAWQEGFLARMVGYDDNPYKET